jgi:hypothetical protein
MARPVRRFGVRRHDEAALQLSGATEHKARTDRRMPSELVGQSSQKGVALLGMDRRGCSLNGVHLVVGQAKRHGRGSGRARRP